MIVSFGDAVVDLFALPRGADVSTAECFVPYPGGSPANVAIVIARLGVPCRFVGAVGTDLHGDRLLAALTAAGVDVRTVLRLPCRTGITFVQVALDGSRSFLSYRHGGADLALSVDHLASLPIAPLEGASWLHLSTSAWSTDPSASTASVLLAEAVRQRVSVSLDLNVRLHLWPDRARLREVLGGLAGMVNVVKASEEDLAALGLEPSLESLQTLLPGALPVLTLAERGAVARVGGVDVKVPAPRVEVTDTTGAGDAFMGALLAGLFVRGVRPSVAGFDEPGAWAALLTVACAVGARAVTALGATEGVRDLTRERQALADGRTR